MNLAKASTSFITVNEGWLLTKVLKFWHEKLHENFKFSSSLAYFLSSLRYLTIFLNSFSYCGYTYLPWHTIVEWRYGALRIFDLSLFPSLPMESFLQEIPTWFWRYTSLVSLTCIERFYVFVSSLTTLASLICNLNKGCLSYMACHLLHFLSWRTIWNFCL